MISRPLIWFIVIAVLLLLALAWWGGSYPARLTIINVSGVALRDVVIESGTQRITVDTIQNGATHSVSLTPGNRIALRLGSITWRSSDELTPARAIVLYVGSGGQVDERSRLGALSR